jgi:hypothetical protein
MGQKRQLIVRVKQCNLLIFNAQLIDKLRFSPCFPSQFVWKVVGVNICIGVSCYCKDAFTFVATDRFCVSLPRGRAMPSHASDLVIHFEPWEPVMNLESFYQRVINPPSPWTVSKVEISDDSTRVDVWLNHPEHYRFLCHACHTPSPTYDHAPERTW